MCSTRNLLVPLEFDGTLNSAISGWEKSTVAREIGAQGAEAGKLRPGSIFFLYDPQKPEPNNKYTKKLLEKFNYNCND